MQINCYLWFVRFSLHVYRQLISVQLTPHIDYSRVLKNMESAEYDLARKPKPQFSSLEPSSFDIQRSDIESSDGECQDEAELVEGENPLFWGVQALTSLSTSQRTL